MKEYLEICGFFYEHHLEATVILDTDNPEGLSVKGRETIGILEGDKSPEGIDYPREFVWVDGAAATSGVIVLPYADYDRVYVVGEPDENGQAQIIYIDDKEATGGARPYYEKVDGKTRIYVEHFSGGGGTQADPYLVSTEDDLNAIRGAGTGQTPLSAYYIQTNDIVMSKFQTGAGFTPIGDDTAKFSGKYDGKGYMIKNLFINAARNSVGLFGYNSGTISNVKLVDVNITNDAAGTGSYSHTGGLAGSNASSINTCCVVSGSVTGGNNTGGLVGYHYTGYIYNSYSRASVSSRFDNAGGFVGYANVGTMYRCYSTGSVTDISVANNRINYGGFAGYGSSAFIYCFWDKDTSGRLTSAGSGVAGRTSSEMKSKNTFYVSTDTANCYDFDLVWHINSDYNNGYPELRQYIRYKYGKGTAAEPFLIYNEFDLNQIRFWRDKHFKLMDDIKMTDHQAGNGWKPIGTDNNATPFGNAFTGTFDGNGRYIADLFINRQSDDYMSLFGYAVNATIKNLDIIDPDITGANYSGVLAGYALNVYITNCNSVQFNISKVRSVSEYAGGLIGYLDGASTLVEFCSARVKVMGVNYCGGFVGYTNNGINIRRCHASGLMEVTGTGWSGGFVGRFITNNVFEDCYSGVTINGVNAAGFCGCTVVSGGTSLPGTNNFRRCISFCSIFASNSGKGFLGAPYYYSSHYYYPIVVECYYDYQLSANAADDKAISKYTAEMKYDGTYLSANGWDFTNTWILDPAYNGGYPALRALLPLTAPILGFRNEFGKYYSDNAGNVLRYLEYGNMIAGQTSLPKPVWLQNNADFSVNNMQVWVDQLTVKPGMTIELSQSESPFIPVDLITFSGTFAPGNSAKFYARIGSAITVKEGGTFDLRAKASPA
ncbi:filamentous hemagglutinin [Desulfocucumis palustris]|uniref:filamentous hemagglutinin n=1 Tax=Desulfocucumis palustris TaxID=1898651 RepID=UPI000FFE6CC9|nr:filamentous hemagglutinin [Desulfocucumis palustris]